MGVLDPLLGLFGRGEADGDESAADAGPTDGDADDDAPAQTPAGFSERAEALSVHAAGAVLDFSVESLADLDEMAADEDATGREVKLTYGSYLGEVLVREFGGEWVDDDGWGVRVSQGDDETTVAVFEGAKMSLTKQPVFQKVVEKLVAGGAEPVDAGPTDVDDSADAAEPDETGAAPETTAADDAPDASAVDTDDSETEATTTGDEADDVAEVPAVDVDETPDDESTESDDGTDEEYTSVVSPVDESAADADDETAATDDGDDSVAETEADAETGEESAEIPTYDDYQPVGTSVETGDADEEPERDRSAEIPTFEERPSEEPAVETAADADEESPSAVSPTDGDREESPDTDGETGDAPVDDEDDDVIPTFEEPAPEAVTETIEEPTSVVSPVGADEGDEASEETVRDRSAEIPTFDDRQPAGTDATSTAADDEAFEAADAPPVDTGASDAPVVDDADAQSVDDAVIPTFEERPSDGPAEAGEDEPTTETGEEYTSVVSPVDETDEPAVEAADATDETVATDDAVGSAAETDAEPARDRSAEIPTYDDYQPVGAAGGADGDPATETADVEVRDDVIPTFEEPPSDAAADATAAEAAVDTDDEGSTDAVQEYTSVVSPVDESDADETTSAVEEAETTPVVSDDGDDAEPSPRPDADERSPGAESERGTSRGDRATGPSSSLDRGPANGISRLPFRTAARAFADDWSGREFDFTLASLLRLDAFIDALWSGRFSRRALEDRSIDPDATDDPLTRVGAYYGETLVANFDGAWVRTDAGEPAVEVIGGGESETVRVYEAARDCLASPSTFRFRYDALANRLGDDGPRARRVRDSGFDLDAGSAEVVTALIADAERFADAWSDYDLDYSPPSLRRVERLLALEFGGYDVSTAEVGTETDHASLCLTDVARAAAAYVAVVFVRHLDAQWHVGERVTLVASTTAGEHRIDPVALAAARLREERSVSERYDDCREDLGIDAPSTRERGD